MVTGCRKYEWIVKGGEEVRIDQRIEQLFDVMNGLMQRQPGAAAHSLQVRIPTATNGPVYLSVVLHPESCIQIVDSEQAPLRTQTHNLTYPPYANEIYSSNLALYVCNHLLIQLLLLFLCSR